DARVRRHELCWGGGKSSRYEGVAQQRAIGLRDRQELVQATRTSTSERDTQSYGLALPGTSQRVRSQPRRHRSSWIGTPCFTRSEIVRGALMSASGSSR